MSDFSDDLKEAFKEFRHREMLRAQQEAATAAARGAAETNALRAEVEASRHEAERREQERERKEREATSERDRKECEATFGTQAFCISCIEQALMLDPSLKETLREHYHSIFGTWFGKMQATLAGTKLGTHSEVLDKWESSLRSQAQMWAENFGPMPGDMAAQIQDCRDKIAAYRRGIQIQQEEEEKRRRREEEERRRDQSRSDIIVGVFAVLVLLALFAVYWAAIRSQRSRLAAPTAAAVPAVKPKPAQRAESKPELSSPGKQGRQPRPPQPPGPGRTKSVNEMTVDEMDQWLRRDWSSESKGKSAPDTPTQ